MTKDATRTVTGSSRYSPQASDQQRKISRAKGNRPAEGFQTSWSPSGDSERDISTIGQRRDEHQQETAATPCEGHDPDDRSRVCETDR